MIKETYQHIKEIASVVLDDQREREIIFTRYRFNEKYKISKPVVLEEIGDQYTITRERVRQIEKEGFDKIRKAISKFPTGTQIDIDYLTPLLKKCEGRGMKTTSVFTEDDWLIKFLSLMKYFFRRVQRVRL